MGTSRKINGAPNVTIVPRKLKDGVVSYFLKYKDGGKWVKESCKDESGNVLHSVDKNAPFAYEINRETKLQLQSLRAQKLLELTGAKVRQAEYKRGVSVATICELYTDYRIQTRYKAMQTIKYLCRNLLMFAPEQDFATINREWVLAYQTFLLNNGLSQTTIHNSIVQLQSLLEWANGKYISFDKNPVSLLKKDRIRKGANRIQFLTSDEVKRLENTPCKSVIKPMFLFACYCGLRWSDIQLLTWDNIRDEDGQRYLDLTIKKTGAALHVPINQKASNIIGERPENGGKVFESSTAQNASNVLKIWLKRASITKPDVSFHTSRHTFACLLLQRGVSLYAIKELLGHKEIESTMVYLAMMDEDKQKAVAQLDNI